MRRRKNPIEVTNIQYVDSLTKGSGRGKTAAIIGITSQISFKKMGIKK